jgi:hypothetical protein
MTAFVVDTTDSVESYGMRRVCSPEVVAQKPNHVAETDESESHPLFKCVVKVVRLIKDIVVIIFHNVIGGIYFRDLLLDNVVQERPFVAVGNEHQNNTVRTSVGLMRMLVVFVVVNHHNVRGTTTSRPDRVHRAPEVVAPRNPACIDGNDRDNNRHNTHMAAVVCWSKTSY